MKTDVQFVRRVLIKLNGSFLREEIYTGFLGAVDGERAQVSNVGV